MPEPAPSTSGTPSVQAQSPYDGFVAQILNAAQRHDRTAWDFAVSTRDPAFVTRSAMVFDNLNGIELTGLRPLHRESALSPERRALLGPTARVEAFEATWRVPPFERIATSTVWLTVVTTETGDLALAGTTDAPAGSRAPLWMLEPMTVARAEGVAVLVGQGVQASPWLDRATRARAAVPSRAWAGERRELVVQVPATGEDFRRVLGADRTWSSTAAAATLDGPSSDTTQISVVVNRPEADALTDDGAQALLVHEATHVATRSPGRQGVPLWVVEGYADLVADTAVPQVVASADETARSALSRTGDVPTTLPSDREFAAGSPDQGLTYVRARIAMTLVNGRPLPTPTPTPSPTGGGLVPGLPGPSPTSTPDDVLNGATTFWERLADGASVPEALADRGLTEQTLGAAVGRRLDALRR